MLKPWVLVVLLAYISYSTVQGGWSTLVPPTGRVAPTHCELDDGSKGYCVHSYLCDDKEINDDGGGLITERKYECQTPHICCKQKKEITEPTSLENRNNRALEETTMKGSTFVPPVDKDQNKPNPCEFEDGKKGYCVQSYLCKSNKIINDGSGFITERYLQCLSPEVCCELDHEPLMSTVKPRTLVPPIADGKPGESCEAYDGSQGRCVLVHLCNNDTTIADGAGLISERGADPCTTWRGAIQICCPAMFLEGKIIPGDTESSTKIIEKTNDNDDSCITHNESQGKCVPQYQCDDKFDGSGVINARYQGSCPDRTVCCNKDNVDETRTTPAPVAKKGCGRLNVDGLWPCTTPDCLQTTALEAKFGEFPWMVAVRTKTAKFPENYNITGGSLIHPSVVLSVAHYVDRAVDSDVRVRAGEWNILDVDEPLPHQEVAVKTILVHPDFNKRNYRNDIALLFLETPIKLLPHIGVVCLPAAGEVVAPSTDCIANGWGKDRHGKKGVISQILKKLTLPAVEHQDCQTSLRTTRLGPFFQLHEGFMCAGGDKLDTCSLDGGSPLTCPTESDSSTYVQHGVVAWGIDCHLPKIPGVYMNVGHYRNWIDQNVKAEGLDTSVYTL